MVQNYKTMKLEMLPGYFLRPDLILAALEHGICQFTQALKLKSLVYHRLVVMDNLIQFKNGIVDSIIYKHDAQNNNQKLRPQFKHKRLTINDDRNFLFGS